MRWYLQNTSSKQISNEKDMLVVGYGSMLTESLLTVVAPIVLELLQLVDRYRKERLSNNVRIGEVLT
jgi:carbon starvation protein CstA